MININLKVHFKCKMLFLKIKGKTAKLKLANVDFKLEYDGKDDFGDVFEYLISIWDLLSEKRERFYTPPEISD